MLPNSSLRLIALLVCLQASWVVGVQNDTNASALTGSNGGHYKGKVIFAYVAFAVGGTLMFVGFIYLIVWALTAKDGQDSPESKPKVHGVYMDQDIAGRKTAPENVGGGEEMKYDPDTYLPIITVSDVPGTDNAYVNSNQTEYHIEHESKSDGDVHGNKNLLRVSDPPRRHSAEDPILKTKRHSTESGKKKRQSLESQTEKDGAESHELLAADRRRSTDSTGRISPLRRGRRHSEISAVSASSRRSSLHDELSRRRASNISISEDPTSAGEDGEKRHSSHSHSRYRPYDSPKYRHASSNVENHQGEESPAESSKLKDTNIHFVATDAKSGNRSQRNSQQSQRSGSVGEDSSSVHARQNSNDHYVAGYGNEGNRSQRNSQQSEHGSRRNSQQSQQRTDYAREDSSEAHTKQNYNDHFAARDGSDVDQFKRNSHQSEHNSNVHYVAAAASGHGSQQHSDNAREDSDVSTMQKNSNVLYVGDANDENRSRRNSQQSEQQSDLVSEGSSGIHTKQMNSTKDSKNGNKSRRKSQQNEQQSDTASEDSGNAPRKKSWFADRFGFKKKKKSKSIEEDNVRRHDGNQSTDDGYSTIEGNTEHKDGASLTKYNKTGDEGYSTTEGKDTTEIKDGPVTKYKAVYDSNTANDGKTEQKAAPFFPKDNKMQYVFRSAGLLPVPIMTATRNSQSYQPVPASAGANISQKDSQVDAYTNEGPEKFPLRSSAQLARESYHSETTDTEIRPKSQETAVSRITSKSSDIVNDEPSYMYNEYDTKEMVQESAMIQSESLSQEEINDYHQMQPTAESFIQPTGDSKRNSSDGALPEGHRNSVGSNSERSDRGPEESKRSSSNYQEPVDALPAVHRNSVGSSSQKSSRAEAYEGNAVDESKRSSSNYQEPVDALPAVHRNSVGSSSQKSDRASAQGRALYAVPTPKRSVVDSQDDNDERHVVESEDTDKAASHSNSNESEGSFSYETAPSDSDSQQYAAANANRHSYNSGDSYAGASVMESNPTSVHQSLSGSMNNRLSADSSALDSVKDNEVSHIMSASDSAVSSGGEIGEEVLEEDHGVEHGSDEIQSSVHDQMSPVARPDSPVPLERLTSTEDDVIENGLETTETIEAKTSSPPPPPPPPSLFIPPPPPLPSMSFPRKPSPSELTPKPLKPAESPGSAEGSPMPFMEELQKRLQKYSDPKVGHGTAAVNVTKVLGDNATDVDQLGKSNIETVVAETETLYYESANGQQNHDLIVKETEPLLYDASSGQHNQDIRDGNNSSLSNESEMSIPQAIESGSDTAPQSPEVPEDNANDSSVGQSMSEANDDVADTADKHVEFRETVSHIPSPASSFSMTESQTGLFNSKQSDLNGATDPSITKLSHVDDLEVASNHPDEESLNSAEGPVVDSDANHQGSSDQSAEQTPNTTSGGNDAKKPEGLPAQAELKYPSEHVNVPMEGTNVYMY